MSRVFKAAKKRAEPRGTKPRLDDKKTQAIVESSPDLVATVIDGATEPFADVRRISEEAGLPAATVEAIIERLEVQYSAPMIEIEEVKNSELLKMLSTRMVQFLRQMTLDKQAKSSIKDLAAAFNVMFQQRQILMNQPTSIVDHRRSQKLEELGPLIVAELQRRGAMPLGGGDVVDAEFEEVEEEGNGG